MKPFVLLSTLLLAPLVSLQAADVVNLQCEYLKDPLGIDVAKPRLSWVIDAPQSQITRSVRQTAYQVLVASTPELLGQDKGDLWDSGKVQSDQSIQVEYAGKPPESRMKLHWKVRLWTLASELRPLAAVSPTAWSAPASWTMGLLKPDDWSAKWITHPDPKRLSHPWLRRSFGIKEDVERAVIYINTAGWRTTLAGEFHQHGEHPFFPRRSLRDSRYHVIHNLLAGKLTLSIAVDGDTAPEVAASAAYKDTPAQQAMALAANPPEWELYDLQTDPAEFQNLADDPAHAGTLKRMQGLLHDWRKETADPFLDPDLLAKWHRDVNTASDAPAAKAPSKKKGKTSSK